MKLFEDEELYSLREIADKLKMAYNTVQRNVKVNPGIFEKDTIHFGTSIRIKGIAINNYIAKSKPRTFAFDD